MAHFNQDDALKKLKSYLCSQDDKDRYILFSAPAGYGKSHLLKHWLRENAKDCTNNSSPSNAIPSATLGKLRDTLDEFDYFSKDDNLRALFVDNRIRMWENEVPSANTKGERINQLIKKFWNLEDTEGNNALIQFLSALLDDTPHDSRLKKLEEVIRELREIKAAKQPPSWRNIDIKALPNERQIEEIGNILVGRPSSHSEDIIQDVVSGLLDMRTRPNLLLIFDSLERATPETKKWLFNFLKELENETSSREVRIVLSGRSVKKTFWQAFHQQHQSRLSPKEIQITPFSYADIRQWIEEKLVQLQIPGIARFKLLKEKRDALARKIHYWSGGHPGIIHKAIEIISERNFPSSDKYWQPTIQKEVQAIANEFLADIAKINKEGPELKKIYRVLSVFRFWETTIVSHLEENKYLPPQEDKLAWLIDLSSIELCEPPNHKGKLYYDGGIMRRVVALAEIGNLSKNQRERFYEIHESARSLCEEQIHKGPHRNDDPLRHFDTLWLIEWLYHALVLWDKGTPCDPLFNQLSEYMRRLLPETSNARWREARGEIHDGIEEDSEILYLLAERCGEKAVERFRNIVTGNDKEGGNL